MPLTPGNALARRARNPFVSVVIPTRNEEDHITEALASVEAQTYRHMEIIVSDGMSNDGTRARTREWAERSSVDVRIIDNPHLTVPAAMNCALHASRGEILVRLDGHAAIGPRYVERCVELLAEGTYSGVGGPKVAVASSPFGRAAAIAFNTRIGSGGSYYHYGNDPREVEHVPFGAYLRAAACEVGGWDESLVVNQDFEFDFRLRSAGHRLLFDPSLRISWHSRETPSTLAYQYYRYGRGKALVMKTQPGATRPRHLAPLGAAGAMAAVAVASAKRRRATPLLLAGAGYLGCVATALRMELPQDTVATSELPGVCAATSLMHSAWTLGLLRGLVTPRRQTVSWDPFQRNPDRSQPPCHAA